MKIIALPFAILSLLFLAPFAAADKHTKAEEVKAGITFEEFVKLPLDQRIEVCARFVSADAIGECAAVKRPRNKPAAYISEDRIQLEVDRCADETGGADIQQVVACARERLNEGASEDRPVVTEAQIKKAEEYCSRQYTGTVEIGSCVAGILRHIDHKGGHN